MLVRNFRIARHLETFLVSAVSSILLIRGFLALTGYPKLGGESLHIAHMLWGGLLMLAGYLVLLMFFGKFTENLSVILAGAGFGTFIDEVGKFLTHDNDYFFQPAVAIIYFTLIVIYLVVRQVATRHGHTPTEYLMNAVHELEEVVKNDLDQTEKDLIDRYLNKSDPDQPLVRELKNVLARVPVAPAARLSLPGRIRLEMLRHYRRFTARSWFRAAIVSLFLTQLALSAVQLVRNVFLVDLSIHLSRMSPLDWGLFCANVLSAVYVVLGALALRKSRIKAFLLFKRAVLVHIFLTQFFLFYRDQFNSLIGLLFYLLILLALRFIIEQESRIMIGEDSGRRDYPSPGTMPEEL